MTELKTHIESMIKKAGDATKPDDAMKFAQAALNAANAMCSLAIATQPK